MKLRPQLSGPASASRLTAGVALIITLIMISVITFMTVTFLAVSRRGNGQVKTTLDQTSARLAAESAQERAVAELLATVLASTNAFNFDLLVSTNYINAAGFDPAAVDGRTNVNFDYTISGRPISAGQALRNLTNLFYNPRPPVFITNRFRANSNEFRFYVDLNRDGVYTPNGLLPVVNRNGGYYDTNGNVRGNKIIPGNTLSNYFTGDPEFLGILERAEFPHSTSNRFVARYAFIILPAGKTLDVNYIGNYAKSFNTQLKANTGDGFRRNQGVSAAEINLASFLVDLNTNAWPGPKQNSTPLGSPYLYLPDAVGPNTGAAFDDSLAFLRYRYATNNNFLQPAGPNAGSGFDRIDAYCMSPLMSNVFGLTLDRDATFAANRPWFGSDNPNHFFTGQDFLDLGKLPSSFVNRLTATTTDPTLKSSYDHYTYYRLLSQLGTDSAPEPATKLNLNYANVGGLSATNFVAWTNAIYSRPGSEVFFTNAVDRLLKQYSKDWHDRDAINGFRFYTNTFGSTNLMGAGNIPVYVNGRFAYTPAVHRLLQLAANMYDAINPHGDSYGPLPTVFRPQFGHLGNNNNLFITNFVGVPSANSLVAHPLRSLSSTNVVAAVQPDDLIFGVPLVVGARKGLPNFNEFSTESIFQITRKLELRKSAPGDGKMIYQTNQMFTIGISNVFGTEFWNSYATNYLRPVDILVTNIVSYSLTNDYAYTTNYSPLPSPGAIFSTNSWPKWSGAQADSSFIVPLRTNHNFIPVLVYRQAQHQFVPLTDTFERPSGFAFPRWGLAITNRVQAVIQDRATKRIVDYVQLSSMGSFRDLTGEMAQPRTALYFKGLWATNSPDGIHLSDQPGIIQQIEISKGSDGQSGGGEWRNYGFNQPAGASKAQEIANFMAFFTPNHTSQYYDTQLGRTFYGTNSALVANAPFSPTWKQSLPFIWQANDPLVHYTTGDMQDIERSGILLMWSPPGSTNMPTLANMGRLNDRYRPWGGNPFQTANGTSLTTDPGAFSTVVKDPGVWSSDWWQFPTNKLPTLGWLGRIHRGTPWQTIYLKSTTMADALNAKPPVLKAGDWQKWSGNPSAYDVANNQPETDRGLFDLFTTAFNDNAARGQLPINQSGLAAWSAVFGGMVALTNSTADAVLLDAKPQFDPAIIEPAGVYDPANFNAMPAVAKIVNGTNRLYGINGTNHLYDPNSINGTRADTNRFPLKTFSRLGDILAVPALTDKSPFLNHSAKQLKNGLNDAVYEWLPQQMLSLVRLGEPRFVVYAYGQALKPANHSIVVSGPYFGLCTNYQITAEVVTRSVVKVVGSPDQSQTNNVDPNLNYPPRVVLESFNVLPPE